jgi:hypothetical protein
VFAYPAEDSIRPPDNAIRQRKNRQVLFVDTSAERFDFPRDSILRGQKTAPSTEREKKGIRPRFSVP